MGTEGAWIPAVIAAVGTAASVNSANETAKNQANILGAAADDALKKTNQAADLSAKHVQDTYDPTKRSANYDAAIAKSEKSLGDVLSEAASLGKGDVSGTAQGALSSDYTRGNAEATARSAAKAASTAKLMARTGALSNLFSNEADANADYSSDLLGITGDIARGARYAQAGAGAVRPGSGALVGGLMTGLAGSGAFSSTPTKTGA